MIGSTLGPWRIESELGTGGMGAVYLATRDGERVALKVVHPHLLETPGFFKRFLREAEIGQSVRHPNLVRTLDCDAISGHHFLVMEYVDGQTLRELMDEMGAVPEELCRHIGLEVAKGISAVHEAGVVHRDLKPENILLTADHAVKVMDLGVARLMDEAIRLSRTGAFVGSIHYASPEQFEARGDIDGRADLHALGLVLYELASGVNPYAADEVTQVIARVLTEEPRRLGEMLPQLSAFFEETVHTLLEKDRDSRFATARELCETLAAGEDSAWWQSRSRTIRAVTRRPLRRIRIPRETAIYGREEELAKLRSLYDQARNGNGRVALVEGEAGIGKSRLVDELIGCLHAEGEDLNFLSGSYPPGGAATASGAFSTAYREQLGPGGAAEHLSTTPTLAPAFEALLTGDATPENIERLTKDSIQTCFVSVTRGLAAERPTVVLIDDLHFAPEEGRALFTALTMAAPGNRVLLVGTLRPGVPGDWLSGLTRLDQVSHLALDRLGPKDLVRLLEDSLRSEQLAIELAGRIGVKSDGNPFFIFEIIRGLREEGRLTRREDGSWRTTEQIRRIQIPSSVRDLIRARVAELDDTERDLLEVAACCGYEFDPSLVARALDLPLLPTLKQFARIEYRHQLLHSAGRRYRFDHHQVQEVLYDHLFGQLREEYHAALGNAMESRVVRGRTASTRRTGDEAVELCEHFFMGALPDRALEYLDAGLDHLEEGCLHESLAGLADRALSVPRLVEGDRRFDLLLRKAESLDRVGSRRLEQRETLDEAVAIADAAGDAALLATALTKLGFLLESQSEMEEARLVLDRALQLAGSAGGGGLEVRATRALGHVHRHLGNLEEARALYERGLEIALEIGDAEQEAFSCGSLGLVMNHLGRFDDAVRYYERDLAILRKLGDRRSEAKALGNLGNVLKGLGRREEARECQERCLALARETGDRKAEAIALFATGGLHLEAGRLDEARELFERCRDLAAEIGFRLALSAVSGNLALVYRSQGRLGASLAANREHLERSTELDYPKGKALALLNLGLVLGLLGAGARARERCEEALEVCRELGQRRIESDAHLSMGEVLARQGDLRAAKKHCERSLLICREINYRAGLAPALTALGSLAVREGSPVKAREFIEEALALAEELDQPAEYVLGACLMAMLPNGDPDAAEEAWRRHSDRLDHLPRMEAHHLLWQITGEASHREEAGRLLAELVESAPPDCRETMIREVPLHREIDGAAPSEAKGDAS